MKAPIFVRSFSEKEREWLEAGPRSKDAFTLRRSRMLLASSRGDEAPQISENLGCGQQTVRDAIHDFNARGVDALAAKSSRPLTTRDAFDEESAEALRGLPHRSPREFGPEHEPLDALYGGGGRPRGGAHAKAGLRGDDPGDALAPSRSEVAAGEAVDHLSRPLVRKKKDAATG